MLAQESVTDDQKSASGFRTALEEKPTTIRDAADIAALRAASPSKPVGFPYGSGGITPPPGGFPLHRWPS